MRHSITFTSFLLLHVLSAAIFAQDSPSLLPQCALACVNVTIFDATNQSSLCVDPTLQTNIAACVKKSCTVKENLAAQNVTAYTCGWSHQDRSSLIRYGTVSLFVFATAAVAARITSRMPCYSGPLGPDDFVITMTWLLLATFTGLIWIISGTGLGRDIWTLPFDDITATLMYFNILTYFYILLTWLTKISILLLYLRLFPDHTFRKIVKITIVLCCISAVSFFVACILRCLPVTFAWTFWDNEHQGKCSDILLSAQGWPHVSVNIFADLVVLFLPLPTIWKLNLPLEKKLSVMAMFSVGIFVTAVSIFRATTFPRLVASTNFTWDWMEAGLWSAIEIYVGVVCACMPGMRAFYTQVFPGRRRKAMMRIRKSRDGATGSSDPSSLGTLGSSSHTGSRARRDDEFELISTDPTESTTRHDLVEEEEETERLQAPRRDLH